MHWQNGILPLTFSTDAYVASLLLCLVVWQKFKILVVCFAVIAKVYHKISVYITEKIFKKNFSFSCSTNIRQWWCLFYGPILPQKEVTSLWGYDGPGPTLPWYRPNFTPNLNYGVMMSHWFFSVLLELIIVNCETLFSEMVLWNSPCQLTY